MYIFVAKNFGGCHKYNYLPHKRALPQKTAAHVHLSWVTWSVKSATFSFIHTKAWGTLENNHFFD